MKRKTIMTCYIRHLKGLMEKIALPDTKESRKLLDKAIREVLGYSSREDCPFVWQELKRWLEEPRLEKELILKLKQKLEEGK